MSFNIIRLFHKFIHPIDFPEYIAYYADVTPAFIKSAMNSNVIRCPIVEQTYKFIKAATRFVNVFHRKIINTSTWPQLKGTLKEAYKYFQKYLTTKQSSIETRFTIFNFIKIVDKLLRAYLEISIAGYREEEKNGTRNPNPGTAIDDEAKRILEATRWNHRRLRPRRNIGLPDPKTGPARVSATPLGWRKIQKYNNSPTNATAYQILQIDDRVGLVQILLSFTSNLFRQSTYFIGYSLSIILKFCKLPSFNPELYKQKISGFLTLDTTFYVTKDLYWSSFI
ncbi:uncharacterized protein ACN2A1_001246 isoform 1-T1 [Glossina fuscipes fuscipes]